MAPLEFMKEGLIKGELEWSERASEGTKKGREESISLRGSYELNWRDYSTFNEEKYGKFRYLLVEVAAF